MDEKLQQTINDQIALLPPAIKNEIAHSDWQKKIYAIGQSNGLHVDQMGILEQETLLVMLGLESPKDFAANIREHAETSSDLTNVLVEKINSEIFAPIRQHLIELDEAQEAEEREAEQAAPTQPSPAIETEDHGGESADDILKEIENPTPAAPKEAPPQVPMVQQEELPAPKNPVPPPAPEPKKDIISQNLTTPTKIDPYRELL